jgi:hypothetical protein
LTEEAVKYWGFFLAKLVIAIPVLFWGWSGVTMFLPPPTPFHPWFAHDLTWTLAGALYQTLCYVVLYVCVWDQVYRCRTCLRRLRMPVQTGSWSHMLECGRPVIEYICTYGHGTLTVPAVRSFGLELPRWRRNKDMWQELLAAEKTDK